MIKFIKQNPMYSTWFILTILIMGVLDPVMAFNVTTINTHVFGAVSLENLMTVDMFWCAIVFVPFLIMSIIMLPFVIYEN
jgi:hypothetical protein